MPIGQAVHRVVGIPERSTELGLRPEKREHLAPLLEMSLARKKFLKLCKVIRQNSFVERNLGKGLHPEAA